jgi:hypothetical protein
MNWEQRLREMVLAGGALAAAACSGGGPNAGPSDASPDVFESGFPCCNANSDPCCPSKYCGEPVSAACACQLDGGAWTYEGQGRCSAGDASPADAGGPTDAAPDVPDYDGAFCCNANPDPCCPSTFCGATVNVACACQLEGGAWNYSPADGGPSCTFSGEAGPSDAGARADGQD